MKEVIRKWLCRKPVFGLMGIGAQCRCYHLAAANDVNIDKLCGGKIFLFCFEERRKKTHLVQIGDGFKIGQYLFNKGWHFLSSY